MPPVSDTVAGIIMIVCGLGMVWSARAYVGTRAEVRDYFREQQRQRGGRRWWEAFYPPVYRRSELAVSYALAVAAIVAGAIVLL